MIEAKRQILKSGSIYYQASLPRSQAVTLFLGIKVGSRYEPEELAGISHFLEHLFFKGTKNRPTSLAIAEELDTLGASFNAFTSEEITGYYAACAASKFPKILDVLSDMLQNATFPAEEIEKERGVIIEEINMYEDIPQSKVQDIAKTLAYGKTALGRPIIGRKEVIKSLTRDQIVSYYKKYYLANNLIITVAGNQGKHNWQKQIEEKVSSLRHQPVEQYKINDYSAGKPQLEILPRQTDQTHIVLTAKAFNHLDPDYPALVVLDTVLGGLMSSRLFDEVREKRGLAYYIGSSVDEHLDTGALAVSSGLDSSKLETAIEVIIKELHRIKTETVKPSELQKAKDNFEGKTALRLEGSQQIAAYMLDSELYYQRLFQPEELVELIKKVTAEDVKRVAGRIFNNENLSLAVVGPMRHHENKDKIYKLLKL